jgi:hypothetical protein
VLLKTSFALAYQVVLNVWVIFPIIDDELYQPVWCTIYELFLTRVVTRLIRRMPLVERALLTLQEHSNSPLVLIGIRVTQSLIVCICFVYRSLCFCTFYFGHCVYSQPWMMNCINQFDVQFTSCSVILISIE